MPLSALLDKLWKRCPLEKNLIMIRLTYSHQPDVSRLAPMAKSSLVPTEVIERRILLIRGQKVMLDFHLAEL
jgi:hypothetical protein